MASLLRFFSLRQTGASLGVCAALIACKNDDSQKPSAESSTGAAQPEKAQGTGGAGSKSDGGKTAADKPSAKEARKITSALPDKEKVQKVVNPKGLEPYTGETGIVRGLVRATGDKAPELPDVLAKMKTNCTTSRKTFGTLFREGPERELADVLVAVTGYDGRYVPSTGTDVLVRAEGCAWDRRTIAMTYGQRLKIDGVDNRSYVPELLGQPMPAQLFVLPTAPDVLLPPQKPGRYTLVDSMRLYNAADVFVLPYATADVTNPDGEFEIKGVPVGEVTINALLPITKAVVEKKITVKAGEVTEVEFELKFDAAAYEKMEKPTPLDQIPNPVTGKVRNL